jgi:hypothetical protein
LEVYSSALLSVLGVQLMEVPFGPALKLRFNGYLA